MTLFLKSMNIFSVMDGKQERLTETKKLKVNQVIKEIQIFVAASLSTVFI